jgi:two-component system, response regulator, stage 0 sporulation protein F
MRSIPSFCPMDIPPKSSCLVYSKANLVKSQCDCQNNKHDTVFENLEPMAKTILVVDDDSDTRRTFVGLLEQKGRRILEAGNGIQALDMLKKEKPSLMLLDMRMPEMDGLETLKRVRAVDTGLKIVMLTSERDLEIVRQALAFGVSEYLTKPVDPEYFRENVARLLGDSGDDADDPWRSAGVRVNR